MKKHIVALLSILGLVSPALPAQQQKSQTNKSAPSTQNQDKTAKASAEAKGAKSQSAYKISKTDAESKAVKQQSDIKFWKNNASKTPSTKTTTTAPK
jgi:hypothetical protein